MSVSVRNIEKFCNEHPEFASTKEVAVAEAKRRASRGKILGGLTQKQSWGRQLRCSSLN